MKPRTLILVAAAFVACGSSSPGAGSSGGGGTGMTSGSGNLSEGGSSGGGSGSVSVTGSEGGSGDVSMTGSGSGTGRVSMTGSGSSGVASGSSGSADTGAASDASGGGPAGGADTSVAWDTFTATNPANHGFTTVEADPAEAMSNGCAGCGSHTQVAAVNPHAKTMMKKLVLQFGGVGGTEGGLGGAGNFCLARGFHVFGVAYYAWTPVFPPKNAAWPGDVRKEEFDGMDHTGGQMGLHPADGVATRVKMGLAYLQKNYPTEAWGYFLAADGSVRWQDVIFTGYSHGASTAARFGYLVGASRIVSSAGPRDSTCNSLACNNGEIVASWFTETPATPITQFYGISGAGDAQHTQHLFAWQKMGLPGTPQEVDGSQPPYTTHRFTSTSSGHDDFCGKGGVFVGVCNYMFGVPPENAAGTN